MSDEMELVLELLWAAPNNDDLPMPQRRLDMDAMTSGLPTAEGTEIEEVVVGGMAAEWLRPPGVADDGALLYLHGGGYCVGSITSHRALASRLAAASGLPALIIDYRLGPEHPFPAAVDDGVAGLDWLLDRGLAPSRIAVAGDSAGGGLTLATLLARRDAGAPLPGAAGCISPWADLTMASPSIDANVDRDPMLDRRGLQIYAEHYLGESGDPRHPLASPVFADLAGLPPVVIHAAEEEVLLDDARLMAEGIEAAGGTVEYRTWSGAFHVFHATAGTTPEGTEAVTAMGAFLAAHTAS